MSFDEKYSPDINSNGITVTRSVKKLTQDAEYRSVDFFDKCAVEPDFQMEQEQITIQASKTPPPMVKVDDLNIPEHLLEHISADEIANIANQLINFAYDPLKVAEHLKDLDDELGKSMQGSFPSHEGYFPSYLIAGRGNFIPGAPPDSYQPLKKAGILSDLLLKRENSRDVNKNGYMVKFIGFVSSMIADRVVSSGQLFNENKQIDRVLLHGSYSHRLLLEAFAHAIEKGVIDLNLSTGKKLNFVQLLEILVSVKTKNGQSLWEMVLDSVEDSQRASNDPLDSKQFSFSCRSPFVLNSLLLCFGKELKLPNLQTYLLDSHYKAAYEMVLRSKEKMARMHKTHYSQLDIPNGNIYERCMEHFSKKAESYGEVGGNTPFTLDEFAMLSDSRYIGSIWGPSVRIKVSSPQKPGFYSNWMEFFQSKSSTKEPSVSIPSKKHERPSDESDEDHERLDKRRK
ncbi:Ankyrin repeat protein [Legionella steigerwaltii]|uniref:Ankyrin repeat protein n=2 Tax=Legionella steigerwaltii TaxID=460 RepID=A0A378LEB6_9GAMM|nr:Ankyrin repeat protein [Legionella steigerwaltii]STY22431.1 Ankyrin repeat protein [Legionella steigerwaltii]